MFKFKREKGFILLAVIIIAVIFAIIGLGVLVTAEQESIQTKIDVNKTKAFYLAEAGLAKLNETLQTTTLEALGGVLQGSLEQGSYRVQIVERDANYYAVSTGTSGPTQQAIEAKVAFLAPSYEDAVYAKNDSGGTWNFQLRGTGDPCQSMGKNQWDQPVLLSKGGKDKIYGNIAVNGDIYLYDQSLVTQAPVPNRYNLQGDVRATGLVNVLNNASISGAAISHAGAPGVVDLRTMDYANNNTHKVAEIFTAAGITSGYLPVGNELRDIFMKNPKENGGTRKTACSSTSVNDYFLEPTSGFVDGTPFTGATPLHLGTNRVYYVDGDLWVHSDNTKGFLIDGQATIVVTGNIHICDNLQYRDANTVLGLVALGTQYDSAGRPTVGGNVFFGDPVNGTMGRVDAMMFAAKDFLYNTDRGENLQAEPRTGFTIVGNIAALNQVLIVRDWYTTTTTSHTRRKNHSADHLTAGAPARYVPASTKWVDWDTGQELSSTSRGNLRHYQMILKYDDKVRNRETQAPHLPIGGAEIFNSFESWREL
jgi:hypothetical protein